MDFSPDTCGNGARRLFLYKVTAASLQGHTLLLGLCPWVGSAPPRDRPQCRAGRTPPASPGLLFGQNQAPVRMVLMIEPKKQTVFTYRHLFSGENCKNVISEFILTFTLNIKEQESGQRCMHRAGVQGGGTQSVPILGPEPPTCSSGFVRAGSSSRTKPWWNPSHSCAHGFF